MSEGRERAGLYVVSAPSGAGKTSLVHAVLERHPEVRLSVSYTTRPRRPSEVEGRDYHFVDEQQFRRMVEAGGFLEHARVFDNWYGTGRAEVERLIAGGHPVVLEIDWQGARQVRATMPECRTVFVLPPSREELERRLRGRGTDSDAVIGRRLRDAVADMTHWREFDHVVVNDAFDSAVAELAAIVTGRTSRPAVDEVALEDLLARLLA